MDTRDLEIYRGDDKTVTVVFTTNNDEPYLLTDGSLEMAIVADEIEQARLTSANGDITFTENTASLHFPHALTKDWEFNVGTYDLQFTLNGIVRTLMRGRILLTYDVTR